MANEPILVFTDNISAQSVVTNTLYFTADGNIYVDMTEGGGRIKYTNTLNNTPNETPSTTNGLTESAIINLLSTKANTSSLGTAASLNYGIAAGNVPVIDADGVLPTSIIPALAITDVFTVANETEMLALTAQKGDIAIRTDTGTQYILTQNDATTLANWIPLSSASGGVTSINGQTGTVVLTPSDIGAIPATSINTASGVAGLDANSKIVIGYLPTTATVTDDGTVIPTSAAVKSYVDTQISTVVEQNALKWEMRMS